MGDDNFSISDPESDLDDQLDNTERRQSLTSSTSHTSSFSSSFSHCLSLMSFARHTLGVFFLLVTVLLFTASNFLASTIFADNSYSKPYFITYINSSFFSVFLVMFAIRRLWAIRGSIRRVVPGKQKPVNDSPSAQGENQSFLKPHVGNEVVQAPSSQSSHFPAHGYLAISPSMNDRKSETVDMLNTRETAKLGFEFCMLWFAANYFIAAGLEFTTVASATILTATCGIWTLMFGSLMGVEKFTSKKVIGVLATLAGAILTSTVDLSGENDKNRGSFPHKSQKQIALGNALAFISAVMYGIYTSVLKKKAGSEERVNMPLFFGFLGIFNMITLLPGLIVLHVTGIEKFQFPPTRRILAIVLINSMISLVSDVCWAYSMLLTSPIVVTVGLSLTIPLSLIGQIIINAQSASLPYWIGAGIVFLSFILVNHEGREEAEKNLQKDQRSRQGFSVVADPHHDSL